MNKTAIIVGIIGLVVIAAGFAIYNQNYFSSSPPSPPANATPTPAPTSADNNGSMVEPGANAKEFTVTGQNFLFSPSTLTVKKGDKVKIIFKSAGGFHDFRIDEFNAATKKINGGQEDTVEFIAAKTGSFEYYCSVGEHRKMGMKGTLVVE